MTDKLHPAAQAVVDLLGYTDAKDIASLEPEQFARHLRENVQYEAFCPDCDSARFDEACERFNEGLFSEIKWATDQWSYSYRIFEGGQLGLCQSALDIGGADVIVLNKT